VTAVAGEGFNGSLAIAVRKEMSPVLLPKLNHALTALSADVARLADQYGFPRAKPVMLAKRASPSAVDNNRHALFSPQNLGVFMTVAAEVGADGKAVASKKPDLKKAGTKKLSPDQPTEASTPAKTAAPESE
jgi:hypothetical protein